MTTELKKLYGALLIWAGGYGACFYAAGMFSEPLTLPPTPTAKCVVFTIEGVLEGPHLAEEHYHRELVGELTEKYYDRDREVWTLIDPWRRRGEPRWVEVPHSRILGTWKEESSHCWRVLKKSSE